MYIFTIIFIIKINYLISREILDKKSVFIRQVHQTYFFTSMRSNQILQPARAEGLVTELRGEILLLSKHTTQTEERLFSEENSKKPSEPNHACSSTSFSSSLYCNSFSTSVSSPSYSTSSYFRLLPHPPQSSGIPGSALSSSWT